MLKTITATLKFRNLGHLAYFLMSIGFFFSALLIITSDTELKRNPGIVIIAATHFFVSCLAIKFVIIQKVECEAFSTDCIWYNALLGIGYLAMYFWI